MAYIRKGQRHEFTPQRTGYNKTLNRPWLCKCGIVHQRGDVICPTRNPDAAWRNSQLSAEAQSSSNP